MFAEPTVRNGHVSHGSDASAYVRFYKYSDKGKESDFVEIIFPGDARTEMRRKVQETDKVRWPNHWAAYAAGEQSKATGYPLEQWREVDEAVIRDLNHKHIYTVEQLASVSDAHLSNLGLGARELVAKAKASVDVMKDTEAVSKYAAQFETIKGENELLQQQNRDLAARLQALEERLDPDNGKKTLTLPKK
ncbi:hypothetical protein [Nitrosovibrio sp. Nv6]|uniref:hypothetical protein n=1 Tax=Nitrosovibrio sp. Nv6 TaxID=1855340 RepID=UPI0008C33A4B|nr:hypothetical protein [Nitrosovibrio sp. Nv6]SEO77637.1 hypothetical protein SAMN05216316_1063 [Nitrosovibrio sp. Nv6]